MIPNTALFVIYNLYSQSTFAIATKPPILPFIYDLLFRLHSTQPQDTKEPPFQKHAPISSSPLSCVVNEVFVYAFENAPLRPIGKSRSHVTWDLVWIDEIKTSAFAVARFSSLFSFFLSFILVLLTARLRSLSHIKHFTLLQFASSFFVSFLERSSLYYSLNADYKIHLGLLV